MGLKQLTQSLDIIRRNEHTNRVHAALRHLYWQGRKLAFPRPISLHLSSSIVTDNEAGGVISMVNMLGTYDYNNMNLVQLLLQGGRSFIDVGANIGAYTLIASEVPEAFVVSLEPNPAAYAKLQRNIARNGRANVKALNMGASAQPGTLHMTNMAATVLNRIVAQPSGTGDTIEVKVTTLDDICADLHFHPAAVKIDVEGHEPAVLAGAVDCMRHADAFLIEDGDRGVIVDAMRRQGLRGPFYYKHRAARLDATPQRLAEDAVFVGPNFTSRFPSIVVAAVN